MSSWIRVCSVDDVPFLEGRRVVVKGFYVGVFNTEEGFYGVESLLCIEDTHIESLYRHPPAL